MRVVDMLFAFPSLILAFLIAGLLGPSRRNAMIAIGIILTPAFARVVRAAVLEVMGFPYVESARALGGGDLRIMAAARAAEHRRAADRAHLRLLLPGDPRRGDAQLPRPRHPAAGGRVGQHARDRAQLIDQSVWMSIFPGFAIMIVVLGFNFLGDGLRDVLDPRLGGGAGNLAPESSRSRPRTVIDLLVRDGLIIDGSGEAPFRGDVAVEGGRIAARRRVTAAAPPA